MPRENILLEKRDDGIASIIISKPARRNAIDPQMMEQMTGYLNALDRDSSIKVIILKGEGDHFSAGGDLKAAGGKKMGIEDARAALKEYCRTVQTVQQMEKPVIAMVRGYAVGGGMCLALACDLIYVSETTKFSCNFLKVGIIPEMGAWLFLPHVVGMYRAKELWFTGRIMDGQEAYTLGLANKVLPDAELDEATLVLAKEITKVPSLSIRITKRIANSINFDQLNAVLDAELQSSPFCSQTQEHKDYIAAFIKK